MEEKISEFLHSHDEVERFFDGLPQELQQVMSGQMESTPHTKPYRQYLQLIMQSNTLETINKPE